MQHLSRRFSGFVFLYIVIAQLVYDVLFNLGVFYSVDRYGFIITLLFRLVIYLPPIIFIATRKHSFSGVLRLNTFSGRQLLFAAGISIFIYLFMHSFGSMLENLFGQIFIPDFPINYFNGTWFTWWPGLLTSCLIPAVLYELAFRGAVQSGFHNIKPLKACLFVGILFGLFQLSIFEFFQYAVFGFALCYISIKAGSIIPGMVTSFLVLFFKMIGLDSWLYSRFLSSIGMSEGLAAFIFAFISVVICGILLRKMPDTSNAVHPIRMPKIAHFFKKLVELRHRLQQSFLSDYVEDENKSGNKRPAANEADDPVFSKQEIYQNNEPGENKNTGFIIGGIILIALILFEFGYSVYYYIQMASEYM